MGVHAISFRSCDSRAHRARLDGAGRDPEQPRRLARREAVEDRGLQDGPQLGRQPVQRAGEVAVLHAEQHLLLGRRLGLEALGRRELAPRPAPQRVDQAADRDAPDPGADLAAASVAGSRAPDGDERVLDRVVDGIRVGAAARQPQRQPRRVALVEDAQRLAVAGGDRGEERVVWLGRDGTAHNPPVASRSPIGSPSREIAKPGSTEDRG